MININNTDLIQTLNNGQQSILLIGVDSLDTPKPQLESLWLVSYLPSDFTLHVLPIFPSKNVVLSNFEKKLDQTFEITGSSSNPLSKNFINTLKENNFWWSGYIIFDHTALLELSNDFSKENIFKQNISMDRAIQALTNVNDDPEKAFSAQYEIIQTACQKISGISQIKDWSPIIFMIPNHVVTDLGISQFINEWDEKLSSSHTLHCRIPTLEIPENGN